MSYHDGSIIIDTKLDTSGINKGLSGLKKGLIAAGAAVGTAFTAAMMQGISFESAFAGVRKTVDATESELAELKQGIRDMAKELPTSANEIAGVAEAAGQLGISKDKILDFTKNMVMLGDSTNLTADEAATTLARFANITGMSQDSFDELGSTIVALGNNFATTEAEISAMGMNIASAGSQVGMSEAQIMGFATALSSVGMEAQAGGTAISKLMIDMKLATETGGESLNQFANAAGMSAEQFKTAFKEDAAGAITSFVSGLNDTERLGKSSIAVLDEMGITEVRLRDSILRAANAGELFSDAIETGTKAWEDNTALTKEAEQRYETMESKLGMLKNGLIDLGISVYDGLEEPLKEAVSEGIDSLGELQKSLSGGKLKSALNGVGELFSELVEVVIKAAKVAIPPLISAVGFLGNNLDAILPLLISGVTILKTWEVTSAITKHLRVFATGLQTAAMQVGLYTAFNSGAALSATSLSTALATKEIVVGALAGRIPVATAAQALWNKVMAANPIGVVVTAVVGLVAVIGTLAVCLSRETEAEKEARLEKERLIKAVEDSRKAFDEKRESIQKTTAAEFDDSKKVSVLRSELSKLVDENGKVKSGYEERVSFILDELNSAFGTEYKLIDGAIEKYGELSKSIDELILKKQAQAIIEEEETLASEAKSPLEAELEVQKGYLEELNKTYDALTAAEAALSEAQKAYDEALDSDMQGDVLHASSVLASAKTTYSSAKDSYEVAKTIYDDSVKQTDEYTVDKCQ